MKKLPVSVVICTLNEEKNIGDCINSVKKNGIDKIILVDASSKDKTVKIAKSLGVKCLVLPRYTLARDRQYGLDKVKTKYVCLVDADNRLEKDCLEKLVDYLENNNFVGVAAQKIRLPEMNDYWSKGWEWHNKHFLYTLGEKLVIGTPALYITKIIKEVGYDISQAVADDNVLCYELSKKGYKVGVGPGVCREKMVSNFKQFKQKLLAYGKGDAEFFLKYPERRLSIATHMLRNYLIKGGKASIFYRRLDLLLYYFLYSVIRYYGFIKTLFLVSLKGRSLGRPDY